MSEEQTRYSEELSFTAEAEAGGLRLDQYLASQVENLSRNRVQNLLSEEKVWINDLPCSDKNYRLIAGDRIKLIIPPPVETVVTAEAIALKIVFEDADLLVINKPQGMVVHPAPGHHQGTLVNALLHHCNDLSGIGGVMRPGIVHRLDKDTSGLLIVAKNDLAHQSLAAQLKSRTLKREYLALVFGRVTPVAGRIEAPIGRHPNQRKKMAAVSGGREAVTRYRVLKAYQRHTLLRVNLETGRTHQIRVHLAHLGYPVVGDSVYGQSSWPGLPPALKFQQALHDRQLSFKHPRSGETLSFSASVPEAFKEMLRWLNKQL